MFTKFPASQNEIADLFQVERKKFFTSITGREYEGGKKMTKKSKHWTPKGQRNQHHPVRQTQRCPHWKTKMHQQDQSSLNLRSQYLLRNITKRSDRSIRPSCVFLPNSNYCIFSSKLYHLFFQINFISFFSHK